MVYRVYVEKKAGFDHEAQSLLNEVRSLLGIESVTGLRLLTRYDVEGISRELFDSCVPTVFSEPRIQIMIGNFAYCNPTKLYFGEDSLTYLNTELPKYGNNVVLIYGGGSAKKNGIYNAVMEILNTNGKNVAEIAGVMPKPTLAKLYEGIEIARNHHADLLLAVGGGSVCDYAKAVSVSVNCNEDPWDKYYLRFEEPDCKTIPVGCVLTMVDRKSVV